MKGKTEVPDWVGNPPAEVEYDLIAWNPTGDTAQVISIDRKEFISITEHLAALRGYTSLEGSETGGDAGEGDRPGQSRGNMREEVEQLIAGTSDSGLIYVKGFLNACARYQGSSTPEEEVLVRLALSYEIGGIDAEDIEGILQEFNENMDAAERAAATRDANKKKRKTLNAAAGRRNNAAAQKEEESRGERMSAQARRM